MVSNIYCLVCNNEGQDVSFAEQQFLHKHMENLHGYLKCTMCKVVVYVSPVSLEQHNTRFHSEAPFGCNIKEDLEEAKFIEDEDYCDKNDLKSQEMVEGTKEINDQHFYDQNSIETGSKDSNYVEASHISINNNEEAVKDRKTKEGFDFCSNLPKLKTECFVRLANIFKRGGGEGLVNNLKQQEDDDKQKRDMKVGFKIEAVGNEALMHNKKEHYGMRHICDQCGHQFVKKKHLLIHMEGVHDKTKFQCEYCGELLSRRALPEHKKSKT